MLACIAWAFFCEWLFWLVVLYIDPSKGNVLTCF